ncbi:MAG: sulfotransferase [Nonlabens sp.]
MNDIESTYNKSLLLSPASHVKGSFFRKANTIKPSVFIIGAQKGGTTSLLYQLSQHPAVVKPRQKEIYYFNNTNFYRKGERWYLKQFDPPLRVDQLQVDATANYLESETAPARLKKFCPEAKIIILLRNPTERAFSHYKMSVRLGVEKCSFENALALEDARLEYGQQTYVPKYGHNYAFQRLGYRSKGCYHKFVHKWLEVFKRDQVLILESEAYFKRPKVCFDTVLDFLHLEKGFAIDFAPKKNGDGLKMNSEIKDKLSNYYRPYNERLFKMIDKTYNW